MTNDNVIGSSGSFTAHTYVELGNGDVVISTATSSKGLPAILLSKSNAKHSVGEAVECIDGNVALCAIGIRSVEGLDVLAHVIDRIRNSMTTQHDANQQSFMEELDIC